MSDEGEALQPDLGSEYRRHLIDARSKAQEGYDKAVIAFAGGALAVSVAFLEKIVGDGPTTQQATLLAGWIVLILCLLTVLFSYCGSRWSLQATIKNLDAGEEFPHRGGWVRATEFANIASGALLAIGVGLILLFAFSNLPRQ